MNKHILLIDSSPIYSSGIKTSIVNHAGISVHVTTYSISDLLNRKKIKAMDAGCAGIRFDLQDKGYGIKQLLLALRKENKKMKIVAYYDTLTQKTLECISKYKPDGCFQLSADPADVGALFKNILLSNTTFRKKNNSGLPTAAS